MCHLYIYFHRFSEFKSLSIENQTQKRLKNNVSQFQSKIKQKDVAGLTKPNKLFLFHF
jgi:hypothetical protein